MLPQKGSTWRFLGRTEEIDDGSAHFDPLVQLNIHSIFLGSIQHYYYTIERLQNIAVTSVDLVVDLCRIEYFYVD